MHYIFTFDDGSEALAHYGKKGMHWGEWNEETRKRYLNEGKLPEMPAGEDPYAARYDRTTGGFYNDTPEGRALRSKDYSMLIADRLLKDAGKQIDLGKEILDGVLGAIKSVGREVGEAVNWAGKAIDSAGKTLSKEYTYLTKGFSPQVSWTDNSSKKFWRERGYTPTVVDKTSNYNNESDVSRAERESLRSLQTSNDFNDYWNSTARKIRNQFGYK